MSIAERYVNVTFTCEIEDPFTHELDRRQGERKVWLPSGWSLKQTVDHVTRIYDEDWKPATT